MVHVIQQSCLEKIRADAKEFKPEYERASALVGEKFAYQVVLYSDDPVGETVKVELKGHGYNTIYQVKQVPVNWPHYVDDGNARYLTDEPTLLPDALIELSLTPTLKITNQLTVLWMDLHPTLPGDHHLDLHLNGEFYSRFVLTVLPHEMAEKPFTNCQYIDPCSIAKFYGIPMFSSEHWNMLGKYFEIAAKHGVTHVLTPLYTPLYGDFPMGGEAVQLFSIMLVNREYRFNFDLLDSWIAIAKKNGIKNFTFPPIIPSLKTLKCPKLKMMADFRECDVFDDETDVLSLEFHRFIRKFLLDLINHLKEIGVYEQVVMQFSYAPSAEDRDNYLECRKHFKLIPWSNQLADVLSTTEFLDLEIGCIPFYSSAQIERYSNYRITQYLFMDIFDPKSIISNLIASPMIDIRKFGTLAFRYNVTSLFNLWFNNYCDSQGNRADVNRDTSNENSLPSGNGFLVYPGLKGPVPTVRLKQMYYTFQDRYAFEKLSQSIPYERIYSRIDNKYKLSLDAPISAEKYWKFREEIYSLFER